MNQIIAFFFAFKKEYLLSIDEYGITSEEWLLQQIAGYMEDSEMSLIFHNSKNLIYRKLNPWKTFKRDHLLKNLEYNTESIPEGIKLTVATQHIANVLAFFFLIIWALFLLPFQKEVALLTIFSFITIFFSVKYIVFRIHCFDLACSFDSFRKKIQSKNNTDL